MTTNAAKSGGLEARPQATGRERTPAQIEADIERTRERLAGTVDAIADRVKPANVARRSAESAKAQVVDEHGHLRTTRAAAIAAAVAGAVGLVLWRRSR